MKIGAYLDRIGHTGSTDVDVHTLFSLHERHARAIPYENIDVQLQRRVDLDIERTYDKIVRRGRGGWCYEMNGLFGWALDALGFEVTRMVAGVHFSDDDWEESMGSHLALRVDLDQPWLADVGFGATLAEPIPLTAGTHHQGDRRFELSQPAPDRWRFHNDPALVPPMFDIWPAPNETLLAAVGDHLQTDPESPFRQNLICERVGPTPGTKTSLIGRVLSRADGTMHTIADLDELLEILDTEFSIVDPDLADLWPGVAARHEHLFGPD